jgi:hypothetical protein
MARPAALEPRHAGWLMLWGAAVRLGAAGYVGACGTGRACGVRLLLLGRRPPGRGRVGALARRAGGEARRPAADASFRPWRGRGRAPSRLHRNRRRVDAGSGRATVSPSTARATAALERRIQDALEHVPGREVAASLALERNPFAAGEPEPPEGKVVVKPRHFRPSANPLPLPRWSLHAGSWSRQLGKRRHDDTPSRT